MKIVTLALSIEAAVLDLPKRRQSDLTGNYNSAAWRLVCLITYGAVDTVTEKGREMLESLARDVVPGYSFAHPTKD